MLLHKTLRLLNPYFKKKPVLVLNYIQYRKKTYNYCKIANKDLLVVTNKILFENFEYWLN